jgi:hypothetical protein
MFFKSFIATSNIFTIFVAHKLLRSAKVQYIFEICKHLSDYFTHLDEFKFLK